MSVFDKLWNKITDASRAAVGKSVPARPTGAAAAPSSAPVTPVTPVTNSSPVPSAAPVTPAAPASGGTNTVGTPSAPVDVEAIMTDLDARNGGKSNWRYSIVDLMSLLDMDHSLANRKALAQELGYTGDMSDSASMNIWLHKQVMKRMAANGGKVPADLLD